MYIRSCALNFIVYPPLKYFHGGQIALFVLQFIDKLARTFNTHFVECFFYLWNVHISHLGSSQLFTNENSSRKVNRALVNMRYRFGVCSQLLIMSSNCSSYMLRKQSFGVYWITMPLLCSLIRSSDLYLSNRGNIAIYTKTAYNLGVCHYIKLIWLIHLIKSMVTERIGELIVSYLHIFFNRETLQTSCLGYIF